MIENLSTKNFTEADLRRAIQCEVEINEMRNTLREEEIMRIEQNESSYQSSVYYLDIISEFERMGDFMINISEARE